MKKAEYKNAVQNRKKITSTYLEFLVKKEKFTVIDVVKGAGVNRGTFYLHFKNLDDVGRYIEEELAENFKELEIDFRQSEIDKTPEIMLDKLNNILSKDIEYYKLIINASEKTNLMDRIKKSILKSISNNFKVMKYVTNYENFKVVVQYIVGGVLTSYTEWFKGNIDMSLKEMGVTLSKMIRQGLKGIIKYNASEYY